MSGQVAALRSGLAQEHFQERLERLESDEEEGREPPLIQVDAERSPAAGRPVELVVLAAPQNVVFGEVVRDGLLEAEPDEKVADARLRICGLIGGEQVLEQGHAGPQMKQSGHRFGVDGEEIDLHPVPPAGAREETLEEAVELGLLRPRFPRVQRVEGVEGARVQPVPGRGGDMLHLSRALKESLMSCDLRPSVRGEARHELGLRRRQLHDRTEGAGLNLDMLAVFRDVVEEMEEKERIRRDIEQGQRLPPRARLVEEEVVNAPGDLLLLASPGEDVEIVGGSAGDAEKLDLSDGDEPPGAPLDTPGRDPDEFAASRDGQDEELGAGAPEAFGPRVEPLPRQEDDVRP